MSKNVDTAEEIASLREALTTHWRIVSRVQGKRDGWFMVVDEILSRAAAAFKTGDDSTAHGLRDLAREFSKPGHPRLLAFTEDERRSLDLIEQAKARLVELGEDENA